MTVPALLAVVLLACSAPVKVEETTGSSEPGFYPAIEPTASGYLQVSEQHEIYWEDCGNPDGIPVLVLHGGPGGRAGPELRRYFDPQRFRIILHDQRGAGRSRPTAEWRDNTTWDLVEDINRLREHLEVEGKAVLWGGSWGSTLALAYAEKHPELVSGLVLRGVFLATRAEIDYFYHGGAALFFPDNFEQLQQVVPEPDSLDYPRQLFEMTRSDDPEVRERAIKGWAYYEIRMVSVNMTDEMARGIVEQYDMTTFSVLENYYMSNGCFLEEGQLLRDSTRIADIPTFIVNGRLDVICTPRGAWNLAGQLNRVKLELPAAAGHSSREPAIAEALLRGTAWVADQIEPPG
jgi:proline iminopeptidase